MLQGAGQFDNDPLRVSVRQARMKRKRQGGVCELCRYVETMLGPMELCERRLPVQGIRSDRGLHAGRRKPRDDAVAIDTCIDAHDERLPGGRHGIGDALRGHLVNMLESSEQPRSHVRPPGEGVIQVLHLYIAERGLDVAHANVEARLHEPRSAIGDLSAVVAKAAQAVGGRGAAGKHHPALAGGDDLARMEAEARRVADGASTSVAHRGADGARSVREQDDITLAGQYLQHAIIGRQPERVDRDDHLRSRRPRPLDRVDVYGERVRPYVHEAQGSAAGQHGVASGWVSEVRDDDLVTGPNAERADRDLERRRPGRHRDRVRYSDVPRHDLLEFRHTWPHGQVAAAQHAFHCLNRLGAQARVGKAQLCPSGALMAHT